jgi:hypothetical protein
LEFKKKAEDLEEKVVETAKVLDEELKLFRKSKEKDL